MDTEGKNIWTLKANKLAKLIVLPSALKGTEGCRRHRRTIKAMKGNKMEIFRVKLG